MDCDDARVGGPFIGGQDSTKTTTKATTSKLVQVHIALKAIGAKTLEDYVREAQGNDHIFNANAFAPATTSKSALDDGGTFALDALDALHITTNRFTSHNKRARGSDDSGGESERIVGNSTPTPTPAAAGSTSSNPLALLPIGVKSKLGKKMAMSRTGSAKEVFQRVPGASAVTTLNEFSQQAGLAAPEYSHKSSASMRCSPDHFVTLRFEGHVFHDDKGAPSVKAGREVCAQLCLDYFFA